MKKYLYMACPLGLLSIPIHYDHRLMFKSLAVRGISDSGLFQEKFKLGESNSRDVCILLN